MTTNSRYTRCTDPSHTMERSRGFTLVELMIAVAIVGILASAAVYMYTRLIKKAKSVEVEQMFGEFKIKQEQFKAERGTYQSTGADETDYHPGPPNGPDVPTSIAPLPQEWIDLRMSTDANDLYCGYVVQTGDAGDSAALGTVAQSFGMTVAPNVDWYYIIAECDWDGDSAVNSLYFARSDVDGVSRQNQGK